MRSGLVTGSALLGPRRRAARGLAVALAALLIWPTPFTALAQAPAQAPSQPAQTAPPAPAQTAPPAAAGGEEKPAPKLSPDQLDALVAPIALYPDPLLSQALMASTYPLEIVQAQQWLSKNSKLKGDELEKAVKAQDWEPAVQATVMVPDLLKRLAEDITWTTNLGNAFLAQQEDVMGSVQRLRKKAKDARKQESNDKMQVETKTVEQKTVVEIQPTSTQVVYVPAYNPTVVWGPPVYAYPPVYYPPPGAMLFTFSMGVAMGAAFRGGYCCGVGWGAHSTVVVNNRNTFVNTRNVSNNVRTNSRTSNWQHSPQHRGGSPYGDRATAARYGGGARGGAAQARAGAAGANRSGPTASGGGRGAGAPAGSDRSGAGGASVGNRSVSPSAGGSAFGGASGGGNRALASSSRGAQSMGGRGGGGRGGGGRGR